ncbi:hypothetical protein [Saccharopolyspora sp. NPDC002376]
MTKKLRPTGTQRLVLVPASELGAFEELSGYGRDMSALALDDYSRTKHVVVNTS